MSNKNIPTLVLTASIIAALIIPCALAVDGQALTSPTNNKIHNIAIAEIEDLSYYWNKEWLGRSIDLFQEVSSITTQYSQTHDYILGVHDCNDMSVELWQCLKERGIKSLITVGNLGKSNESFLECNHTWLMVYSGEGSAIAVDVATANVYSWEKVSIKPQLIQYWEGFLYEKPSDLLIDFQGRW